MPEPKGSYQSILAMDSASARAFLLEEYSYCRLELPSYFTFDLLLSDVANVIGVNPIGNVKKWKPEHHYKVNHTITDNKDGKHAWRPMEIIHPALYVSLVNLVTNSSNWKIITDRFGQFQAIGNIRCHSIPVKSLSDEKNQTEQVSLWLKEFEQRSIELSLTYDHVIHTDIANCYGSLYTHSIAWALHTQAVAKANKKDDGPSALLGNIIDWYTRAMRNGQTNGIPQGSVLYDFIAEMVLGYADELLSDAIAEAKIADYKILRYRDDYRIFTNGTQSGEVILKLLTETLHALGLRLHSSKTALSSNVVKSAVKADKLSWARKKQSDRNLLTHLLLIHGHSEEFPNSGSLVKGLGKFLRRIIGREKMPSVRAILAVAVDIAIRNPRTYPSVAAILSHLVAHLDPDDRIPILNDIRARFGKVPNTGYMDIWMQRFTYFIQKDIQYQQPLCQLLLGNTVALWESKWIQDLSLASAIDSAKILDQGILDSLKPLIQQDEIDLYLQNEWY